MEYLILKYLKGELSEKEADELRSRLKEDPQNRKIFENMVGAWDLTSEEISDFKKVVLSRLMASARPDLRSNEKGIRNSSNKTIKVAAVIALLLCLSIVLWFNIPFPDQRQLVIQEVVHIEKEAQPGQKLIFELPDGSIVKLNSGSKLRYPEHFTRERREIRLTGEAFFEVSRDEFRPFVITAENLNVEVLGTSFVLRSYPNDLQNAVMVKSGKVSVTGRQNKEKVILYQNEMAVYATTDDKLTKDTIDDELEVYGWMNQQLVFREIPFDRILKEISRWYGVDFSMYKEIDTVKPFTATYKNPSLKEVMESLSHAYKFKYEIKGKNVIIY